MNRLYYNTVTPYLKKVLKQLMVEKEFEQFVLVGGTSLSLQRGHRFSIDIDLFTDAEYGSVNFNEIDKFIRNNFPYVDASTIEEIGPGKSYFIGESSEKSVKLDIFYTDTFSTPFIVVDDIRMAACEEILAMKLDIIGRAGRKKDFWDVHEMTEVYSIDDMLTFHERRHPYIHDPELIKKQFSDFSLADEEADPECLKGKIWELIKLDLIEFSKKSAD